MKLRFTRTVLSLASMLAISIGLAVPSSADDLDGKKTSLESQVAAANQSVDEMSQELTEATTKVAESRTQLADAQAQLAKATSERDSAQQEADLRAQELAQVEQDLADAKTQVQLSQEAVEEQRSKAVGQMQSSAQQNTALLSVAMLFTKDENAADINKRVQWSQTVYNQNSLEMDRLTNLQLQMQNAQTTQTELENQAVKAREAADAQVVVADQARQAAEEAQNQVEQLVAENEAAENEAQKALDAQKAARDTKQQELNQVIADIQARNAEIERQQAEQEQRNAQAAAQAANAATSSSAQAATSNSGTTLFKPANGPYTSPYGWRTNPVLGYSELHDGLDIGAGCGTPIYAAESGTVARVGWVNGYGWQAVIDHGYINGKLMSTGYNHAQGYIVSAGQYVTRGQQIGYIGTTGLSTGCHLHFHVFVNGATTDPAAYL